MNESIKELLDKLPFAEYGKIFQQEGRATDFVWLNRSSNDLARGLYDFYNKKIAIFTVAERLPFANRGPGYGAETVALMRDPIAHHRLLFLQLEQRNESELLLRKGLPTGTSTGRSYNQARFVQVPPEILKEAFKKRKAVYSSLLLWKKGEDPGTIKLPDYTDAKPPRIINSYIREWDENGTQDLNLNLKEVWSDDRLLIGLVNYLHQSFNLQARREAEAAGRNIPSVVVYLPELDMVARLQMMEKAQSILTPATGILTFTLDYITEPNVQVYLCPDEPPAWMFFNVRAVTANELRSYAQKQGYYQALGYPPAGPGSSDRLEEYYKKVQRSIPDPIYSDPLSHYLSKLIPPQDAVRICFILDSGIDTVLPGDFPDLFLRNLRNLRTVDVDKIIRRCFDKPELIQRLLSTLETPLALLDVILKEAAVRYPNDLASYYKYYSLVNSTHRFSEPLLKTLIQVVRASSVSTLDDVRDDGQAELITMLLTLAMRSEQLVFSGGQPIVNTLLLKPGPELFKAVGEYWRENPQDGRLQKELSDVIVQNPGVWTKDQQLRLKEETGWEPPNLFVLRIIHFLSARAFEPYFRDLPLAVRCNELLSLLKDGPQGDRALLSLFNAEIQGRLRSVSLDACSGGCLESLRFAGWWMTVLAGHEEVFEIDYPSLFEKFRQTPGVEVQTRQDESYRYLLGGKGTENIRSLQETCLSESLGEKYEFLLEFWVTQKNLIGVGDIRSLIYSSSYVDRNDLLARIVQNASQSAREQADEIHSLSAEDAVKWLKSTGEENSKLRQSYLDSSEDLLYRLLVDIKNPTSDFAWYMLAQDPAVSFGKSSWDETVKGIEWTLNRIRTRKDDRKSAQFVSFCKKLGNTYSIRPDLISLHLMGIRRLTERMVDLSERTADFSNDELRLFIIYAHKKEIDKEIRKRTEEIFQENLHRFFYQLPNLDDDVVFCLDLFFEHSGLAEGSFKKITDEGRNRFQKYYPKTNNPPVASSVTASGGVSASWSTDESSFSQRMSSKSVQAGQGLSTRFAAKQQGRGYWPLITIVVCCVGLALLFFFVLWGLPITQAQNILLPLIVIVLAIVFLIMIIVYII